MARSPELVSWLRSAGEPTRLRLLALCSERDFSVSDLAQAVGQSEPRVSRHLRILCDAGLIARLRHGQWVHYRLVEEGPALGFVQGLLAQLDRGDPVRARDRARILAAAEPAAERPAASDSRLGRTLRSFIEGTGAASGLQSALVVGVEHLELLESAARMAKECTAIAHSRRAAQSARTCAEQHAFSCRVLLAASSDPLSERDTERAGAPFDAVVLDRFAASGGDLTVMLTSARRALSPGGRLWVFERYEALESSGKKVIEHPIARMRRLLKEAGLTCERLSPIEADGEHVLAALALPSVAATPESAKRQA
jgi:DNA-binding transcriptional ArsR family regulator